MATSNPTIEFVYNDYTKQIIHVETKEYAQEMLEHILKAINIGDKAFRIMDGIVSLDNIRSVKIGVYVPEKSTYRISEN